MSDSEQPEQQEQDRALSARRCMSTNLYDGDILAGETVVFAGGVPVRLRSDDHVLQTNLVKFVRVGVKDGEATDRREGNALGIVQSGVYMFHLSLAFAPITSDGIPELTLHVATHGNNAVGPSWEDVTVKKSLKVDVHLTGELNTYSASLDASWLSSCTRCDIITLWVEGGNVTEVTTDHGGLNMFRIDDSDPNDDDWIGFCNLPVQQLQPLTP